MELKFLTEEEYLKTSLEAFKRMKESGLYKSDIKSLFIFIHDNEEFLTDYEWWEFASDNWNGNDILRHLIIEYDYILERLAGFYYYIKDNQHYIFFHASNTFYEISWYKSRGRTEKIFKDGEPISLKDYIALYNHFINYIKIVKE